MVAEFESDLIRLRTREGMKVAQAKGHLRGKQPKLNHRQEAHLVSLLETGDYTTADLADLFGVARSTVYRAVEREGVLKAGTTSTPCARDLKLDLRAAVSHRADLLGYRRAPPVWS